VVTALLAAAAFGAPWASTCPATAVSFEPVKIPGYSDVPWALARPIAPGIAGSLPDYLLTLRDARVNRSDGLVLWTTGSRIVWNQPGVVTARRLDRPGRFTVGSVLRFPSVGCWRLTLRGERGAASIVARVIAPPRTLGCGATLLRSGNAYARPLSSGIRGGWPWQTSGPATLTTHGHDGDRNMKVLWRVSRKAGGWLTLTGTRLDAQGSFRQQFSVAGGMQGVFPSIVDIPAAGCWLLRLRTGDADGVLVVRAVDARG
jgi:hypothetical protein